MRQVHAEFIARVEQKLRRRLAAAAGLVGRFGRNVNFLKTHAVARQFAAQMLVHALHVRKCEVAAPDAGLVGDDEQFEPGVREPLQRRRPPGEEGHVLDAVQIISFLNQHPVAVEKNSPVHFSE